MMRTFAENLQNYDQVVEVGGNRDKAFSICLVDHLLLDARVSAPAPGWSPPAQSWAFTPARKHPRLYGRYIQRTEAVSREFPQFLSLISFHSHPITSFDLTHARCTSDRGSIPPVFESLPEIRIREASSCAESEVDERAKSSVPIPAATPDRSPKNAFKPKRVESWWWLSAVSETCTQDSVE